MPFLARIKTSNPREDGVSPGRDASGTAPSRPLLGSRSTRLGNNLNLKAKIFGPQKNCRPNPEVGLTSGNKEREGANHVGRKMMCLQMESGEKRGKEGAH